MCVSLFDIGVKPKPSPCKKSHSPSTPVKSSINDAIVCLAIDNLVSSNSAFLLAFFSSVICLFVSIIIGKITGYNKQYKTVARNCIYIVKRLIRQPFHIADR